MFLLYLLLALVVLIVPGALFAGWLAPALATIDPARPDGSASPRAGLVAVLLTLGWGIGAVSTVAFYAYLFGGWHVSRTTMALTALAHVALVVGVRWRSVPAGGRLRALLPIDLVAAAWRRHWLVLVISALVGLVYFLRHDGSLATFSCIYGTTGIATSPIAGGETLLHVNVDDARLGNTAVLSGLVALFLPYSGDRVLYGLCGILLALGGWLLGWQTGRRAGWGWLGLIALALNPYLLSVPLIDENVLSLSFSAVALPLLLLARPPWLVTGLCFGLVLCMRHVLVLSVPALLWLAWTAGSANQGASAAGGRRGAWLGRLAPVGWLCLGLLLATFVEHLHHLLSLGSLLRFESNPQFPKLPYSFLGLSFHWEGMLGWPFYDTVVRTPHNPLPMIVTWPLAVAVHLGAVGFALALAGTVAVFTWSRRVAVFWLLYVAPVAFMLAVQESWDHANKMGVVLILFAAVAVWLVAGARYVVARPANGVTVVAALTALCLLGGHYARAWHVPADPRYLAHYPDERPEVPSFIAHALAETTAVGLAPDYRRIDRYSRFLGRLGDGGLSLAQLGGRFGPQQNPWAWRVNDETASAAPYARPPVTVALDLGRPVWDRSDLLQVTDGPPHVDLTSGDGLYIISDLALGWDRAPLTIYAIHGQGATVLHAFFGPYASLRARDLDPDKRLPMRACEMLDCTAGRPSSPEASLCSVPRHEISAPPAGEALRIRMPAGPVSVVFTVKLVGDRARVWLGRVGPDRVDLSDSVVHWHN